MFDRAFLDHMKARPTLLPKTGTVQYGKSTYGTGVPFPAYWVEGNQATESAEGGSSNRNGTIYAAPPAYWDTPYAGLPSTDDAVDLPDGSPDLVYLKSVMVYRDEDEIVGLEMVY